jgi:hypothetical protein
MGTGSSAATGPPPRFSQLSAHRTPTIKRQLQAELMDSLELPLIFGVRWADN